MSLLSQRTSQRAAATSRKRYSDYEYDPEPGDRSPSPASGARVSASRLSTEDRRFGALQPRAGWASPWQMHISAKAALLCCGTLHQYRSAAGASWPMQCSADAGLRAQLQVMRKFPMYQLCRSADVPYLVVAEAILHFNHAFACSHTPVCAVQHLRPGSLPQQVLRCARQASTMSGATA